MSKKITRIEFGKEYTYDIANFTGIAVARAEHVAGCVNIALQPSVKKGEVKIPEKEWFSEAYLLGFKTDEQLKEYNPPPSSEALGKYCKVVDSKQEGKCVAVTEFWPERTIKLVLEAKELTKDQELVHYHPHIQEVSWKGQSKEAKEVKPPGGPQQGLVPTAGSAF